jgi:hypothetical protein
MVRRVKAALKVRAKARDVVLTTVATVRVGAPATAHVRKAGALLAAPKAARGVQTVTVTMATNCHATLTP